MDLRDACLARVVARAGEDHWVAGGRVHHPADELGEDGGTRNASWQSDEYVGIRIRFKKPKSERLGMGIFQKSLRLIAISATLDGGGGYIRVNGNGVGSPQGTGRAVR